MAELNRPKEVAITTLPDGGTYATIFYFEEVPLGITAEKFKELMLKTDSGRKVEIFSLNQAAKCVFDRKFTEFVKKNEEAFIRLGMLQIGKTLSEHPCTRNPPAEGMVECFQSEIKTDVTELIKKMEKEKIAFGELR